MLGWDPIAISTTHSQVTGLAAGFAFAALFLLLDKSSTRKDYVDEAMLLLFVSFVTGFLGSFLYSTIAGDQLELASVKFIFPSIIFVVQIYFLLAGISLTFAAFSATQISAAATNICRITIFFALTRIFADMCQIFNLSGDEFVTMLIISAPSLALAVSVLVFAKLPAGRLKDVSVQIKRFVRERTLNRLVFTAVLFSFCLAWADGYMNTFYRAASEAQTPEAQTPEAQTPEAQTPEAQTPEAQTSEAQTPEAQTPEAQTPEAQTPEAQTPEAQTSEAQTSEAQMPMVAIYFIAFTITMLGSWTIVIVPATTQGPPSEKLGADQAATDAVSLSSDAPTLPDEV